MTYALIGGLPMKFRILVAATVSVAVAACAEKRVDPSVSFGFMAALTAAAEANVPDDHAVIEKVVIMQVACKSPADEAGILQGDEVTAMDGTRLIGMTVGEYIRNLRPRQKGARVTLTIHREGVGDLTAELVARPITGGFTCGLPSKGKGI